MRTKFSFVFIVLRVHAITPRAEIGMWPAHLFRTLFRHLNYPKKRLQADALSGT